ncbi:universal stress protein [Polaribacter glomeratus]|uniref:Universal stress protein, UspA family n=1 Tax=Polaribacter glomeratus TaxID=102 RepID=A0A2S7WFA5_9FLAO|nr:universal stress protein [Polaribacter glomeratus]PQJ76284.1 universal stress protein, UspA family [Polaribacter glomeratus]TXD63800.1 universal stress protein [Polaribacter glomeratus]
MKHILLPTDFSENAYNAMSYAVQLYKDIDCTFYILYTYTPISISAGSMIDNYSTLPLIDQKKEIAERKLKEIEDRLNTTFSNTNHTFISMVSLNLLLTEMAEVIKEKDIDFVIMGTKGATGAKEIFIGSNTMQAVKNLKCPIMAIPSGFKYEKPSEILFPTDYEVHKSNKYLSLIKELCEKNNSRLHLLNVYQDVPLKEKQEQTEAFLDVFFKNTAHLFHNPENQELTEAIVAFEKTYKVNFLVMIYKEHNFFENLLLKPTVNQMVYHTNIPFLVIPSEEHINH